ncbi:twin-arginine translocation signal domain-containing protein, partial [Staphylococcus aureus]|uniref:twin-arginine translocation signal domain-containing protein n=1 Tax=Staphylococcus aureus TaxID=1280 RepID=UPI002109367F
MTNYEQVNDSTQFSRRKFLKILGIGGAGVAIGATVVGTASPIHQEAQAATTPYYTYHGYIVNCSRINLASKAFPSQNDNITHHATVPLKSGQELFGILNVASPYTEI